MISIQIFILYIHIPCGSEAEEQSLDGDTYTTDAIMQWLKVLRHLTNNSSYTCCYNAQSSHLEMVKIAGS